MKRGAGILLLFAVGLVLLGTGPAGAANEARTRVSSRVLIVTMPTVSWSDVERGPLPELRKFSERAGIANLATRIGKRAARIPDAYVTMGAGTRSLAFEQGLALEVDEPYGTTTGGVVYQRRTGAPPTGTVVQLDIAELDRANARTDYEAAPGALGDHLHRHGVTRAVIGNADLGREIDASRSYRRPAVAALMDGRGEVPGGAVATDLLRDDASAPFGVRLEPDAVLDAFNSAWEGTGPRVVLVEASDLSRTDAYRAFEAPKLVSERRREALADADQLLGRLLAEVDFSRDAVLVVAPVSNHKSADLSLFAMAAPGLEPGLLRSATTRRDGFVQLADIGPTVLDRFGIAVPSGMEGRPASFGSGGGSAADRREFLADTATEARIRDRTIPYATTLLTVLVTVLAIAFAFRTRLPKAIARLLPSISVVVLALIPATFLAAFGAALNVGTLLRGVLVPAALIAVALELVRRKRTVLAVGVALTLIVGLIALDLVSGAHLQLNTLFGYSVAVGGRFAGLGNLAFGFLAAATLLLAITVSELVPGPRGIRIALGVLVFGVLLDGLPMLGGDVGGVITMVPAFGVAAMLLMGRRVRARHVVAWFAAGGLAVLAFGMLDLLRPAEERTHLARTFERVRDNGIEYISQVVERRWEASLGGPRTALWILLLVGGALLAEFFLLHRARSRTPSFSSPQANAAVVGLAILGAIGLIVNDSGLAVPGVILAVGIPVLVLRAKAWRLTT